MPSYDLIASANFTSSANVFSITGIPGGYTDCVIVISQFRADANSQLQYTFNNDTNINYAVGVKSMNMNQSMTDYNNNISGGFYTGVSYGVGSASYQTLRIHIGRYADASQSKTWVGHGQAQNNTGTSFESTIFGGNYPAGGAITSFQIRSGANLYEAKINVYGIIDS